VFDQRSARYPERLTNPRRKQQSLRGMLREALAERSCCRLDVPQVPSRVPTEEIAESARGGAIVGSQITANVHAPGARLRAVSRSALLHARPVGRAVRLRFIIELWHWKSITVFARRLPTTRELRLQEIAGRPEATPPSRRPELDPIWLWTGMCRQGLRRERRLQRNQPKNATAKWPMSSEMSTRCDWLRRKADCRKARTTHARADPKPSCSSKSF